MIDTILEILKSIAAILPVILLCLATRKINLEKNERSRQFPMPVIALVYVITHGKAPVKKSFSCAGCPNASTCHAAECTEKGAEQ